MSETNINTQNQKPKINKLIIASIFIPVVILGCYLLVVCLRQFHDMAKEMWCAENLSHFKFVMQQYGNDYEGQYPTADKWCDLLVKHNYTKDYKDIFICEGALASGNKGQCHYAINPNAEPNSPADIVLLFETKGGWNQFGGPGIVTFENHNGRGCNILFNDGHVEFIKPKNLLELKWKVKENSSNGKSFPK